MLFNKQVKNYKMSIYRSLWNDEMYNDMKLGTFYRLVFIWLSDVWHINAQIIGLSTGNAQQNSVIFCKITPHHSWMFLCICIVTLQVSQKVIVSR